MAHTYRCYLLNARRHFAAVEIIECPDDRTARRRAEQILAARPVYSGVEVWEWERRVHVQLASDTIDLQEDQNEERQDQARSAARTAD
jgi:hypothetical protein